MATATITPDATRLLTAEEFLERYGHLSGVELIDGRVVWGEESSSGTGIAVPQFRHGVVSYRIMKALGDYVDQNRLGWIAINDSFVITQSSPDRVRGADGLLVLYTSLPPGNIPETLRLPPDLVVEVRSPSDRWSILQKKMIENLDAGVRVALLVDPSARSCTVYRSESSPQTIPAHETLMLPDLLPGFQLPLAQLFD